MKTTFVVFAFLLCVSLIANVATAGDVEDVKAAYKAIIKAWNTGDMDEFFQHLHDDLTGFDFDEGPLVEDFEKSRFKALYEAGMKPNVQVRQLDVNIIDNTAIITCYWIGSIKYPGDTMIQGCWRFSEIRVKQAGKWKAIHYHISPLDPVTP